MSLELDHKARRAAILRADPALRTLFGSSLSTAWLGMGAVILQFAVAIAVSSEPWWVILLAAYGIGAFAMHCANCVVHETCHNLVFRGTAANKAFAIFMSLPSLVPSAVSFRHYHLLHHAHFGERGMDSDVPAAWEVRLVGRSLWRKLLWLLLLPVTYCVIHPLHVRQRVPIDVWLVLNIAAVALAWLVVFQIAGWPPIAYLLLSAYFSVGPHPAGAHILQEHVAFDGGNGMSSYYGPINRIAVNLGYHLEHHDLPNIPGWRLPQVSKKVPQFYSGHFVHRSRARGLWCFVADGKIGLDSRPIIDFPAR
jgi:sphingolipid 4-desaturase/C4-monooxygenase